MNDEPTNIIRDYPALAARSAASILDPDAALLDGVLSLSGEVDELAQEAWAEHRDNVLLEAGDVLWYIAVRLLPAFKWNDERAAERWSFAGIINKIVDYEWVDTRSYFLIRNLIKYKLRLTEQVKKRHASANNKGGPYYEHYQQRSWARELTHCNGPMADEVGYVLWGVYAILREYGYTLEDALEANVAKLKARHPGGFDADYASKEGE